MSLWTVKPQIHNLKIWEFDVKLEWHKPQSLKIWGWVGDVLTDQT